MKAYHSGLEIFTMILLISSLALIVQPPLTEAKPAWLVENAYLTYEQVFVWSGKTDTMNMTWEIIQVKDDHFDANVSSYTVDDTLNIIPVVSDYSVDSNTRTIVDSTETYIVGYKWFFWIETNVSVGTTVDTGYGNASISRSEKIAVLGPERDTWFIEHDWTSTTYMKRWYDKATGIVLKIQVGLEKSDTQIQVTETAKSTNINFPPLQPNDSGLTFPQWVWLAAIVSTVAVVSAGVAAMLKWKTRQNKQKGKLDKAALGFQLEDTGGF